MVGHEVWSAMRGQGSWAAGVNAVLAVVILLFWPVRGFPIEGGER